MVAKNGSNVIFSVIYWNNNHCFLFHRSCSVLPLQYTFVLTLTINILVHQNISSSHLSLQTFYHHMESLSKIQTFQHLKMNSTCTHMVCNSAQWILTIVGHWFTLKYLFMYSNASKEDTGVMANSFDGAIYMVNTLQIPL